jgi:uncharacterized protein (TIGR03435 family)
MRLFLCAIFLLLLPVMAFSQPTETAIQFEVADVHTSPRSPFPFMRGPFFGSGRYELRFASMLDLIRTAYNVDPEKVTGGPSWLEMDRFDVFAKIPAASTVESRRLMLQALLAERFKLVTHKDNKPMASYVLIAGKQHRLKEPDLSAESKCDFTVQNAPTGPPAGGGPIQMPVLVYTCRNMSMETFAGGMLAMPGVAQYLNNKLVVDKTELKGSFDFTLRYTPKMPAGIQTIGESIPIFDALEKQLGLKLDMSTVPMPVIVVDNVNQKPTPNSAEALKSFPPLPSEFEVASLKPSDPSQIAQGGRPDIKHGRLFLPGISLKNLIQIAWEINGDEFLAGLPKWADDDRYEILAKAPAEVAIGDLTPQRNGVSVNIDALRPMIKALVVERFKLVAHMEDRPMNAYNLVAAKPKLTKSDPATRTKWSEGPLPEAKASKNANTTLGRLVNCQNVTMAQFAEMLPGIAPGYLRTAVVDATGIEGGFDFTFSFSPAGIGQGGGSRGPAGEGGAPSGEASEPSAAISLFDAMTRQLGLKLELQKRPTPVLVIDHIERKPTDN